jgi:hypothetical protein
MATSDPAPHRPCTISSSGLGLGTDGIASDFASGLMLWRYSLTKPPSHWQGSVLAAAGSEHCDSTCDHRCPENRGASDSQGFRTGDGVLLVVFLLGCAFVLSGLMRSGMAMRLMARLRGPLQPGSARVPGGFSVIGVFVLLARRGDKHQESDREGK